MTNEFSKRDILSVIQLLRAAVVTDDNELCAEIRKPDCPLSAIYTMLVGQSFDDRLRVVRAYWDLFAFNARSVTPDWDALEHVAVVPEGITRTGLQRLVLENDVKLALI